MDKRVGAESIFGVGGGTVSRESQIKASTSLSLKALEDDNNLDAAVQMAFLMPNLNLSVEVLEGAEIRGRANLQRILGRTCFEDGDQYVGRFWSLLETRPYMRVLQALVRLAFENKDYDKSARTIIEMLRLCPGDNMGQRDWLGSVLLQAKRPADALAFVQAWLEPNVVQTGDAPERGGCVFPEPSKEPMDAERVERLGKYCKAELVYTGALAAFTLWGDCPLAQQYLLIGVRLNPHVLLKILAKVEQPRSLNMSARSLNGPEAAHDYLWLTQNLWMVPEVWAWADGYAPAKACVLKSCARASCGRHEETVAQFKRCGGCKGVVYCGTDCQKQDWNTHKPKCHEQKRIKETIRAMIQSRAPRNLGDGPLAASADFSERGISTHFFQG
ncbi:hypothetical protein B0H21DRAFT_775950 [Amylocystis lapponica]|nr:hypothetical protein B0H21DRAFT_775950 [Amylocystis lapponica]